MSNSNLPAVIAELEPAQLDVIRSQVAPDANDVELVFFLEAAKRYNLDPLLKQIYFIKRSGRGTIQVGIDGLVLIAVRTGEYRGHTEPVWQWSPTERAADGGPLPVSCRLAVRRKSPDGDVFETPATAYFHEYAAGNSMWKKMPRSQLEKCALARALRRAFPDAMSGLYTAEEMDQADAPAVPGQTFRAAPETDHAIEAEHVPTDEVTVRRMISDALGRGVEKRAVAAAMHEAGGTIHPDQFPADRLERLALALDHIEAAA